VSESQGIISPALQLLGLLLAIVLAIGIAWYGIYQVRMHDPYVQQVMAVAGVPEQGREIFQINCAGCHGAEAHGLVGPSLDRISERKSRLGLIHQVVSGDTPPMPKFQPSPEEMANLLSYLRSL
ncbi:MAG: cytochrome c, partial [Cyanobacteria bacterium P01_H01_bin.121]